MFGASYFRFLHPCCVPRRRVPQKSRTSKRRRRTAHRRDHARRRRGV